MVVGARVDADKKIRTNFLSRTLCWRIRIVTRDLLRANTQVPKSLPGLDLKILARSSSDVIATKLSSSADARGIATPFNMICGQSEPQRH